MFKKKLIAFSLSLALVASLGACGKSDSGSSSTSDSAETSSSAEQSTSTPKEAVNPYTSGSIESAAEDHSGVSNDCIVDFEDGNFGFAVLNESDWARDKDSVLSVADAFGSKALVVTRPNGNVPAVAIDVSALLGDNASKVAKYTVDLGVYDDSGKFSSCAGTLVTVAQKDDADVTIETQANIYKSTASCKTMTVDLGGASFTNKSYISLGTFEDGGTVRHSVSLDNFIFYDASGKALPVDSSKTFAVEGVGTYDWSNSTAKPENEVLLFVGGDTGTGWWPQPVNSWSYTDAPAENVATWIDPTKDTDKIMKPGDVITVYYSVYPSDDPEKPIEGWQSIPYIRAQNWAPKDEENNELDDGTGWMGKIADIMCNGTEKDYVFDEDGTPAETMGCNESFTIVQFDYEIIQAAVEAQGGTVDWQTALDFIGIADRSAKIKIKAVTIGQKAK